MLRFYYLQIRLKKSYWAQVYNIHPWDCFMLNYWKTILPLYGTSTILKYQYSVLLKALLPLQSAIQFYKYWPKCQIMTWKMFRVKTTAVLTKEEPEPQAVPTKKQVETFLTSSKSHLWQTSQWVTESLDKQQTKLFHHQFLIKELSVYINIHFKMLPRLSK